MLVDPNTGMSIEMDTPESLLGGAMSAQSASAGALSAVGQQAGFFGPGSIPDAALDAVPGLSQTTAWNTFRGSRTILYGGKGVNQISGFRATMSPRFLTRLPSMEALGGRTAKTANYAFNSGKYTAGQSYTPFNVLTRAGNYAFRNVAKMSSLDKLGKFGASVKSINAEGAAFNIGSFSRLTAMSKISRGKASASGVETFLKATDSRLLDAINVAKASGSVGQAAGLTSAEGVHALAMSMDGAVSGRVAGFLATTMEGKAPVTMRAAGQALDTASKKAGGEFAGTKAYQSGSKAALEFMGRGGFERVGGQFVVKEGSEKMFAKAGLKVGDKVTMAAARKIGGKAGLKIGARLAAAGAASAVPVAGQIVSAVLLADLAMDVGKLGVEVFKSGVDFAKDAAISYKGSINKGVMGMGYRDNTVAATSRSRGVQAIQNSRLNARSVLGSEAGAMHAHFG